MLSFRSILLAAAAFATIASAIPTPDNGLPLPAAPDGDLIPRLSQRGVEHHPKYHPHKGHHEEHKYHPKPEKCVEKKDRHGHVIKKCRHDRGEEHHDEPVYDHRKTYTPDVVKKCHDNILEVVVKIKDSCHGRRPEEVDHKHVIGLFGEIIVILKVAIEELKLVVVADLFLGGVLCTVKELAELLGGLVIIIVEVLFIVLKLVGFVDVVLCDLVKEIGALLCVILEIVIVLVEGLLVEIVVIIAPYRDHCDFIHFLDLFAKIHLF